MRRAWAPTGSRSRVLGGAMASAGQTAAACRISSACSAGGSGLRSTAMPSYAVITVHSSVAASSRTASGSAPPSVSSVQARSGSAW